MADYTITPANVTLVSTSVHKLNIGRHNAGVAIDAGEHCYLDANNLWQLVDANASTAHGLERGVAYSSAGAGQPLSVCIRGTLDFAGTTFTAGIPVFASANAGGLAPSTDLTSTWYPFYIGSPVAADQLLINCEGTSGNTVIA